MANITPIKKVPFPTAADFRPINLIAILLKVLERIVARYILLTTKDHWSKNSQYGFLPNFCTMDAIIQVIESWSHAKDIREDILAIFFDFAKAFDLVPHHILLDKLLRKGYLKPWLVSWIAAYLTNRKQRVATATTKTDWKPVEAGVVQGSVLGPILFILFILDINDYLPKGFDLLKYADDILAYITGKAIYTDLPQQIVDGVNKWCAENGMRLNTSKCKVMQIKNSNITDSPPTLNIGGQALEVVDHYKYLGINMHDDLKWEKQWQVTHKKIKSIPFLILRLKKSGFKTEILISVYNSYALSHFIYSAPLFTNCNSDIKREMDSFQSRILKIINITPTEALSEYGIRSIDNLIDHHCVQILKRMLSNEHHPLNKISYLSEWNKRKGVKRLVQAKARTDTYRNSIVQKYIPAVRDGGVIGLYTQQQTSRTLSSSRRNSNKSPNKTTVINTQPSKLEIKCEHCGKSFKGIRQHIRLAHSQ